MLRVQNVNFSYQDNFFVLKQINFSLHQGEIACILGKSGSGKSTLLKLIYGEIEPSSGQIDFNQTRVKGPSLQLVPGHPQLKYVPQDFQLEKYISVAENVGKFLSNIYLEEKKNRIDEVLKALMIEEIRDKKPTEISGGQQQRVAIARAVASKPELLLLDEPFSNLDAYLHQDVRDKLFQFLKKNHIAAIFTSHRPDDALGYSDKIIILEKGEILQNSSPKEVYNYPKNESVAQLFGKYNFIENNKLSEFQIPTNWLKKGIIFYPEEVEFNPNSELFAYVRSSTFVGREYEVSVLCKGIPITFYHNSSLEIHSKIPIKILQYRFVN